jgi:hypothetical protein
MMQVIQLNDLRFFCRKAASFNNPYPTHTGVMLGNGDGTFGAMIDVPSNGVLPIFGVFNSTLVLIADMNGDGHPLTYSIGPAALQ